MSGYALAAFFRKLSKLSGYARTPFLLRCRSWSILSTRGSAGSAIVVQKASAQPFIRFGDAMVYCKDCLC